MKTVLPATILCVLVVTMMSASVRAHDDAVRETPHLNVSYFDAELTTKAGRRAIEARIHAAAERACSVEGITKRQQSLAQRRCVRDSTTQALSEVEAYAKSLQPAPATNASQEPAPKLTPICPRHRPSTCDWERP